MMSLIGSVETYGGPFVVLPTAKLGKWSGNEANQFFGDEEESDYERLCDIAALGDQPDPAIGAFPLMTEFPALEVHTTQQGVLISPCLQLESGDTLANLICTGRIVPPPPEYEVALPPDFLPLAIFDAAHPGSGLSPDQFITLDVEQLGQRVLREYRYFIDDLTVICWGIH